VLFPLEEVPVAVQVVLVGNIEDLNDLGPAHYWGVKLVILADGAKPGGAGGNENESVEYIASNEVPASAGAEVFVFWGAHLVDDHVEAHEVDVVGDEVHDEKSKDVLSTYFIGKKTQDNGDIEAEQQSYKIKVSELLSSRHHRTDHKGSQQTDLNGKEAHFEDVGPALFGLFRLFLFCRGGFCTVDIIISCC